MNKSSKTRNSKNNSLLLYGKTILVTGATSDEGKSIAMKLASEGAKLALIDNDLVALDNLAKNIKVSYNINSLVIPLNLRKDRASVYNNLAKRIAAKSSHLDGVILAANQTGYTNNILTYPTLLWKEIIQVNLDANFILVKTLLPFLLSAQQPCLIFRLLDENNALQSGNGAYGVSKYALDGFMKMLAAEMSESHLAVFGITLENGVTPAGKPLTQSNLMNAAALIPKIMAKNCKEFHGEILDLLS